MVKGLRFLRGKRDEIAIRLRTGARTQFTRVLLDEGRCQRDPAPKSHAFAKHRGIEPLRVVEKTEVNLGRLQGIGAAQRQLAARTWGEHDWVDAKRMFSGRLESLVPPFKRGEDELEIRRYL